jgi:hypothetical protein
MAHGDLPCITHENVEAYSHDAMNDNQVEEINGKSQDVGFGHDPRQDEQKHEKYKRTNQNRLALKQFNIFVVRSLDVHFPTSARWPFARLSIPLPSLKV